MVGKVLILNTKENSKNIDPLSPMKPKQFVYGPIRKKKKLQPAITMYL